MLAMLLVAGADEPIDLALRLSTLPLNTELKALIEDRVAAKSAGWRCAPSSRAVEELILVGAVSWL